MEHKFDLRSIKVRVWVYFLLFTVIILGLIWFLQIFFLDHYYENMKTRDTMEKVEYLSTVYDESDLDSFLEEVDSLTRHNDLFIRIDRGDEMIYPNSTFSLMYLDDIAKAKTGLEESFQNTGARSYTSNASNDKEKISTFSYAMYLGESEFTVMTVITPLYPQTSTVEILQNQLYYIILIALALSFLISYYLSTRVSDPLRKITRSAKRLANGQYGVDFPALSKNDVSEIKDLNNTLNIASKELDKSVALQKDLMANVSHDLRTPLTMIKSYAEMIRDLSGDIPEKREAHLQVIIDEADRLNTLVSDVMSLSSMQAGTTELNMSTFDMKAAAESIVAPYLILENNEGYDFTVNCNEPLIVEGDEDKIKQVMSNLITNAIKYCGEDKKIIVNIRKWGRKVHFEVIDHGVGIKPDEIEHIWDRYYKTSSNHVRTTSGSGLGLSIVKEILTLHKARYGAESKEGKGTTIWFELELAAQEFGKAERKKVKSQDRLKSIRSVQRAKEAQRKPKNK